MVRRRKKKAPPASNSDNGDGKELTTLRLVNISPKQTLQEIQETASQLLADCSFVEVAEVEQTDDQTHRKEVNLTMRLTNGMTLKQVKQLLREEGKLQVANGKSGKKTKKQDKKQQQAKTPPETTSTTKDTTTKDTTTTKDKNGDEKTKQQKKIDTLNEATSLASCFHLHINANDDLLHSAVDRQALSEIFQTFLTGISTNDQLSVKEKQRLESLVMSILRKERLMKSKRVGEKVIITMAGLCGPGDFPSPQVVETERTAVLEKFARDKENKHGVIISDPPNDVAVVKVHGTREICFTIQSTENKVTLQEPVLLYRGRNFVASDTTVTFPMVLDPTAGSFKFQITFRPRHVGVHRCTVKFKFLRHDTNGQEAEFEIIKCLKLKSGDAKLEKLLQPTGPYQPKRSLAKDSNKKQQMQTLWPPKETGAFTGAHIPFKSLPRYYVPKQMTKEILNGELEGHLANLEIALDSYSTFWSNLLWANEMQVQKDITLFDMEKTTLTFEGNHVLLRVPGLAEGRPSVLRGDVIKITWKETRYMARVLSTRNLLDAVLQMHSSFLEDFDPSMDTVDVCFTFSRTTFRSCHHALAGASDSLGEQLLLPRTEHHLMKNVRKFRKPINFANRDLNTEQQQAVENIVSGKCRPLPYIVWGPPGTGKTTTVVEAVYQLAHYETKPNILLVAPSNDAADILVEKLSSYFPTSEMRRLLAHSRSIDSLHPKVIPYAKDNLSVEELIKEAQAAQVIVCTVNLAARLSLFGLKRGHFQVLCVDEAGHATEPEVVAVASSLMDFQQQGAQLILAGDPKQLGPVITSDLCRKFGLHVSYMERLSLRDVYQKDTKTNKYPASLITRLVRNYRSHPSILKLPNEMFYEGVLIEAGDVLRTHDMTRWEFLPRDKFPIIFHSLHGENLREGTSPSWFNPQEAEQVVNYVEKLVNKSKPPIAQEDIGVVTPYARQASKIRLALASRHLSQIKVGSVETFQGQERRVIILSTVRSQKELIASDLQYNLGFVANPRRFNVALTRASSLLIVIGDPHVLATDKKNWLPFLQYCKENGSWMGEEWDASSTDNILLTEAFEDGKSNELDDEQGVSALMAQEAIGFINREE